MRGQPVLFHELTFIHEADDVLVGRTNTGPYAVLPADGAALLQELHAGATPEHAAQWYESKFGQQVNIDDFLDTLHDLGFIRPAGESALEPTRAVGLRWIGRAVFSPLAWLCYVAILAFWVIAVAHDGALLPRPGQIFFTGSLLLVQLGISVGQLPLIFLHEAFHLLAGRRLGLRSRLGISNRYLYIVFETQMNDLLGVPRQKRYLPFLAGMICDAIVFAVLGVVAELTKDVDGTFSLVGRIALGLAFTVLVRMAWQLQLYLRTDLYYVFATALNCYDLHDASTALLRNKMWRLLGRSNRVVDEQQWTVHDRRVGRWYGPFIVVGICAMISIAVFASAPVLIEYVETAWRHIGRGRLSDSWWDGLLSLLVLANWVVVPGYLSWRKRRIRHREGGN
jgi:hypothetical protein